MNFAFRTLLKKGWRSDEFWTQKLLYKTPVRKIPVYTDTSALLRSQYWPRNKLNALIKERLISVVRVASRLPFWKSMFERNYIDLDSFTYADRVRLPVISKKTLLEFPAESYVDVNLISYAHQDSTSGSTGIPFSFYFDWPAELRSFATCERMFITAAKKRYPVIGMRARHKPGFASHGHHFFFLRGCNSLRHRFRDLAQLINSCADGCILYGYTSAILEVAKLATQSDARLNIRAAIATGEALTTKQRRFIEQNLQTGFYLNYATRELGWLGYECEQHAMHLNEEWAFVEILDERDMPVQSGTEGRIVVTPYDNRAMPLIRYDIGDRGTISTHQCPCGRTLQTITLSGRKIDHIELGGGRTVPLINLSSALDVYSHAVRQFQFVQTGPLSFTIRVVPNDAFSTQRETIREHLQRLLHPAVHVEWELVEDIAPASSGKAIYFVRQPFDQHA